MPEEEKVIYVDINLLIPNRYQPRTIFNEDSINELALSIKEHGILNPILVRKIIDKYEIIAGERRWRAAKSINFSKVPVIIKNIKDNEMAELALIENLQRENLTPIEEAKSYQKIINLTNITQETLGTMLGKSQSNIANKLRLLSLPDEVQEALNNKKISERHARSLMNVENKNQQIQLLNRIIKEKLTVKDLETLIKEEKTSSEEIKMTISDIMESIENYKSDNQNTEDFKENIRKEEKESDKMNEGNFFPNFNNQMNNTSLNNLNMQSMNQINPQNNISPIENPNQPLNNVASTNTFVNETVNNPQSPQMIPQSQATNQPVEEFQPLFNTEEMNPIPTFNTNNQFVEQPVANENNQMPVMEELPNTNSIISEITPNNQAQFTQNNTLEPPVIENFDNSPLNIQENNQPVIEDTPLFITPENVSPVEVSQPNTQINEAINEITSPFEVPVMTETNDTTAPSNLDKTVEFLNQSNIPYKMYSNETGHCIIIEF